MTSVAIFYMVAIPLCFTIAAFAAWVGDLFDHEDDEQ